MTSMGGESETLRTPLLNVDAMEHSPPIAAEALLKKSEIPVKEEQHQDPVAAEAIPLSLTEDAALINTTSGLVQRQTPRNLSLPNGSSTSNGGEGCREEEKSIEKKCHELGLADTCLVLVYAQWIWPTMVFSDVIGIGEKEMWFASMVGNSLFVAMIWWVKNGAAAAAAAAAAVDEKKENPPQQRLVRTDILPTVVWGILPPLSAFLSEYPEAVFLLILAVLLPLSALFVIRCKRDGLETSTEAFCNCCSRCLMRAAAPFERFIPLKSLEENYFEDQRNQEASELKKLEEQQERLGYLEELRSKDPKKTQNHLCSIAVLIALSVASVSSLIYTQLFLIAPYARALEYTWPKKIALEEATDRGEHNAVSPHTLEYTRSKQMAANDVINPNAVSLNSFNWGAVVHGGGSATFVNFCAPWAVYCQRLAPTWEKFAREVRSQDMHLTVATVNCVDDAELCRKERVMAFPTLRWYQDGRSTKGFPNGISLDQTVENFVTFSKGRLRMIQDQEQ